MVHQMRKLHRIVSASAVLIVGVLASCTNSADSSRPVPTFSARSVVALGTYDPSSFSAWQMSDASNGAWRANRRDRWTNVRGGGWQKMAANFLIQGDEVPVAAMFSGEAHVSGAGGRMFVRLLVDGQVMQPEDVVFARGGSYNQRAARSFEFIGTYGHGLHTLEAQWRVDGGASGFIRDAALLIRQGDTAETRGTLLGVTPPSGLNLETASTEVGHQVFLLADLYAKYGTSPDVGTRPGTYGLMDQGNSGIAPHLNPAYKLALGWVTPRIKRLNSRIFLEDVKFSREVVVLPRSPGLDADEYLVLENRPDPPTNENYDKGLADMKDGLAIWHIVESMTDSGNPPPCHTLGIWNTQTGLDAGRRGIRLVRPSVNYNAGFRSLWRDEHYDLDEFGLVCPATEFPDDNAHNVLLWSDGSPSYEVINLSAPGAVIAFNIAPP